MPSSKRLTFVELLTNFTKSSHHIRLMYGKLSLVYFFQNEKWWAPGFIVQVQRTFHIKTRLPLCVPFCSSEWHIKSQLVCFQRWVFSNNIHSSLLTVPQTRHHRSIPPEWLQSCKASPKWVTSCEGLGVFGSNAKFWTRHQISATLDMISHTTIQLNKNFTHYNWTKLWNTSSSGQKYTYHFNHTGEWPVVIGVTIFLSQSNWMWTMWYWWTVRPIPVWS